MYVYNDRSFMCLCVSRKLIFLYGSNKKKQCKSTHVVLNTTMVLSPFLLSNYSHLPSSLNEYVPVLSASVPFQTKYVDVCY